VTFGVPGVIVIDVVVDVVVMADVVVVVVVVVVLDVDEAGVWIFGCCGCRPEDDLVQLVKNSSMPLSMLSSSIDGELINMMRRLDEVDRRIEEEG